jgi:hypothetical protein
MMLRAIAASTGRDGTATNPSVASASVMLWASVNAVMVFRQHRGTLHEQEQAKHEEQVIDPEQDVLDA